MSDKIKANSYVLVHLNNRKSWLIKVRKNDQLHTHSGFIDHNDIIGKEFGTFVEGNLDSQFVLLEPLIEDFVMKSIRPTQVVYPKDLGLIAAITGMSPGKNIIETGTGSGTLTCFAANLIKPRGRIYSYECRKEFLEKAKKNIEKAGLLKYVHLIEKDASNGIEQTDMDIALLDVGDPWNIIPEMHKALKGGGIIASISPTYNQVEKVVSELERHNFVKINTFELLARNLEVRSGKTRPAMRMVGHTAYLTFGRKTFGKI